MSGLRRVVMHWAASSYNLSQHIQRSYHEIAGQDGKRYKGTFPPEANIRPVRGRYAAHIAGENTGSIGLSMICMAEVRGASWPPGPYPMTDVQLDEFCNMVAEYLQAYDLERIPEQCLTHGEAQPKRRPVELCWFPGFTKLVSVTEGGDYLRDRIKQKLEPVAYFDMGDIPSPVLSTDFEHLGRTVWEMWSREQRMDR